MNFIQSLENLAHLHTAREHLPNDIVQIIELTGSVDSTPIDKIYHLADDCADRYYTQVIETLINLIKCNQSDHQTVSVNTARALRFIELHGERQDHLWKFLEVCGYFPQFVLDVKLYLEADFKLLKEANIKNFASFKQSNKLQHSYNINTLCAHTNILVSKLTQMEHFLHQKLQYPDAD